MKTPKRRFLLFIFASLCLSKSLLIRLFIYLFIRLFTYLFIYFVFGLFIYLFICLVAGV